MPYPAWPISPAPARTDPAWPAKHRRRPHRPASPQHPKAGNPDREPVHHQQLGASTALGSRTGDHSLSQPGPRPAGVPWSHIRVEGRHMGLNIKNEDTYRLVQELAKMTGESQTAAVTIAVR